MVRVDGRDPRRTCEDRRACPVRIADARVVRDSSSRNTTDRILRHVDNDFEMTPEVYEHRWIIVDMWVAKHRVTEEATR